MTHFWSDVRWGVLGVLGGVIVYDVGFTMPLMVFPAAVAFWFGYDYLTKEDQ